jgi:hypothetical protein
MFRNLKSIVLSVGMTSAILLWSVAVAEIQEQATVDEVLEAESARQADAQHSQQVVSGIHDKTSDMLQEYLQVMNEVDELRIYNAELGLQVEDQQQLVQDLDESIDRATVVGRKIVPLTKRLIDNLDIFVQQDLPFQLDNRRQRITMLRNNFARADLPSAEKFRQVLEAYSIERQYGNTIAHYHQTIELKGDDLAGVQYDVDVLRIGRLALLFQSPDGGFFGHWNHELGQWQVLSGSDYRRAIRNGIAIANKQAMTDMLLVPVKAAGATQ